VAHESHHRCASCGAILPEPPRALEMRFVTETIALLFFAGVIWILRDILFRFGLGHGIAWVIAVAIVVVPLWLLSRKSKRPQYRCHTCKHRGFYQELSTGDSPR